MLNYTVVNDIDATGLGFRHWIESEWIEIAKICLQVLDNPCMRMSKYLWKLGKY